MRQGGNTVSSRLTGEIRDTFAQAEADPDALIGQLVEFEQAILKVLGTEYLNPELRGSGCIIFRQRAA